MCFASLSKLKRTTGDYCNSHRYPSISGKYSAHTSAKLAPILKLAHFNNERSFPDKFLEAHHCENPQKCPGLNPSIHLHRADQSHCAIPTQPNPKPKRLLPANSVKSPCFWLACLIGVVLKPEHFKRFVTALSFIGPFFRKLFFFITLLCSLILYHYMRKTTCRVWQWSRCQGWNGGRRFCLTACHCLGTDWCCCHGTRWHRARRFLRGWNGPCWGRRCHGHGGVGTKHVCAVGCERRPTCGRCGRSKGRGQFKGRRRLWRARWSISWWLLRGQCGVQYREWCRLRRGHIACSWCVWGWGSVRWSWRSWSLAG